MYVATHVHFFKFTLYFTALVMKLDNSSTYKAEILTMELNSRLLSNTSLCTCPFTFITEAFHIVTDVQMLKFFNK